MIGVAFDCGDCIRVEDRDHIEQAVGDHDATCRECPDQRTAYEKRLDELGQKNWEARVDAALKEAKESA